MLMDHPGLVGKLLFLYETYLLSKAGEKIPVQLSATVLSEGDREIGLVGFFRDLREIRKMEQESTTRSKPTQEDSQAPSLHSAALRG